MTEPHARPSVSVADIDAAAQRLEPVIAHTPLQYNQRLSARTGARVFLKREDLQLVRSYKLRGAYNLIAQLDPARRAAGVVCASAGNHAQGVAFACRASGIDGAIFLPRTTPRQKRDRIRAHGGDRVELILVGDTFDDAALAAAEHADNTGAVLVPPFDDLRTIAGQGTVIAEALAQLDSPPDLVVCPVGGGGLIAGTVTYLAARSPSVTVVGAEPLGAASMAAALAAGTPVRLDELDPFVDGAAVRQVGGLPLAILQEHPVTMVTVEPGAICTEMLDAYQTDGIIAEPAGALASAALPQLDIAPGSTVVVLLSGGNNDVSRYGEVVERSLVYAGLKHYFLVEFPQEPGALRRFLDEVLGPDDDITLFEYIKRNNRETGPALVGIELGDRRSLAGLLERMAASPMEVERILPGTSAYRYLT